MNNNIIIINGPNLNLLGDREQSQYGSITYEELKLNCISKSKELGLNIEFAQSNIEGEIVNFISNPSSLDFLKHFSFKTSIVSDPYCDCSLSPNRLRFGPLIIIILLDIQHL